VNQFKAIIAQLEAAWPKWQVWYVPRAVGGTIWCARRRDGNERVINENSSVDLAETIEQAEKDGS
jgi:hypothetical protein